MDNTEFLNATGAEIHILGIWGGPDFKNFMLSFPLFSECLSELTFLVKSE